uniref:Uncharacterized protein n=1 Tax=Caenorhabditis tropicalis TaxID=1561998 RepID=A0A1I7UVX0_9PELO
MRRIGNQTTEFIAFIFFSEFALSKVEADYFSNVEEQLKKLDENCTNSSFIINVVDPLSIAAETTLFGGTVKFVNSDTVGSKIIYLKVC